MDDSSVHPREARTVVTGNTCSAVADRCLIELHALRGFAGTVAAKSQAREAGLAMRDVSSWSLSLGRWGGVSVRLHGVFFLFAVLVVYLSLQANSVLWHSAIGLGVLLVSVFAHELAHCFTAVRLGGVADQIALGPLGGMTPVSVPHYPRREAIAILAGPAANLTLFSAAAIPLALLDANPIALLNPLDPRGLFEVSPALSALKMSCWLNWLLFLVNLLPAVPLDGGPALRAWLTPSIGYHAAVLVVSRAAKLTAVALCLLAWIIHDDYRSSSVPPWLPLVSLAIFVFFSARVEAERLELEDEDEDLLGYDFSQGYTSLERQLDPPKRQVRPSGAMRRWIDSRREARRRRRQEIERDEEQRFDEILGRIHIEGMNGLTSEERALLVRVSARYRSRQSQLGS